MRISSPGEESGWSEGSSTSERSEAGGNTVRVGRERTRRSRVADRSAEDDPRTTLGT